MRLRLLPIGLLLLPVLASAQPLPVGGGLFRGWSRYDVAQPSPPHHPATFAERYDGGTLLLAGHDQTGPQVALVSDWYLAFSAEFQCTHMAETWKIVWRDRDQIVRRTETISYGADCRMRYTRDGTTYRDIPNIANYQMWSGMPLQCNTRFLGEWNVTLTYNDVVPVDLAGTVMRPNPQVLSGNATARVALSTAIIAPEIRDERSTPVGAHMASIDAANAANGRTLQFQIYANAQVPGGSSTVTASVTDDRCLAPLPGVTIDVGFVFEAESGGHSPHPGSESDRSPVLSASISSPAGLSVLNSVDRAQFSPLSWSFDAVTGVLSGETVSEGTLVAFARAGEVAGRVRIRATVDETRSTSAFAPGAVVLDSAPQSLNVGFFTGMVPIQPSPGLYHLSGNRFSGTDLFTPGFGDNHDVNHFIQPHLQQYLIGMAAKFQLQFPGHGLNIDDASLVTGGLFDVKGTYSWCTTPDLACSIGSGLAGHEYHRFGNDVDIRIRAFKYTPSQIDDPRLGEATPVEGFGKQKILDAIQIYAEDHGGVFAKEDVIHVRFP